MLGLQAPEEEVGMSDEDRIDRAFGRWVRGELGGAKTFSITGDSLAKLQQIAARRRMKVDAVLAEAIALEERYSAELYEGRTFYVKDEDGVYRPIRTGGL